jgi:vitamin B12 transporter
MKSIYTSINRPQIHALLLTLLLLFCADQLWGQYHEINGQILDEASLPLPGVNIYLAGTYDGASSDLDGYFSFTTEMSESQELVATFIGMDTFRQSIVLSQEVIEVNIKMIPTQTALGEIVVSAGLIEASSDKKRAAALSPMDIVLVASASADIAGAMNLLPGTTRNGESGQILVRGGAAYETKTYMDGMLIDQAYNSSLGNVPSRNRFSPFMFKGTSFSTGGYGAEYGQALSSALLLHTSDLAPETSTGLMLLSVGGSLSHTHRWEDQSLNLSAEFTDLAPYFSILPQNREWVNAPQSQSFQSNYKKQISERGGMLKVYTNLSSSTMTLKDQQWENPLQLDNTYTYINSSIQDERKGWLLFAGFAANFNNDKVSAGWVNQRNHQSIQTRFTAQRDLGFKARIKMGAEQSVGSFKEAYTPIDNESNYHFGINNLLSAAFTQVDLQFSEKWVGQIGTRLEYSNISEEAYLSPRLSIAHKLGPKEQFSLAFGRYIQTPEYDELKLNRRLDPEQSTHLLANYQKVSDDYVFRVEAYQKWYDDLIKYTDNNSNNSGTGYARGLDLYFRDNKTLQNGDYWISYSYLDTKRDWRNFPIEATPHFAMTHSFSLAYKQFFSRLNTAFSTSYSFNSGRPYFDPRQDDNDFHSARTPQYHDISSTFTYLTNVGGNFTVFYCSITNLLGFDQVFGYEFNQNTQGQYIQTPIDSAADRMAVFAMVMNFGERYKKEEVTSDDY